MGARKANKAAQLKAEKKQKAIAIMRDCPTSPRKMRLVADIIRGVEINKALGILRFSKKEASIREIAQTIVDHDVSGLPVMDDDGTVCGIVSEGDLVRKEFAPELPDELCILGAVIYYSGLREYQDAFRKIAAISAEQLMTKKLISVKPDDDVSKVAKILYEKHIKRVPVLDDEKHLLGIVSRRDIVKMMLA